MTLARQLTHSSTVVLALLASACGGKSSEDGSPPGNAPTAFELRQPPINPGEIWQLNRPIEMRFSKPVSFSPLAIRIESVPAGAGPSGTFERGVDPFTGFADASRVRFQPSCPTQLDGSDAGFLPGRTYRLVIPGLDGAGTPQYATDGEALEVGFEATFSTASGTDPAVLFQNPSFGPPRPAFRGRAGVQPGDLEATRIELGEFVPFPTPIYFRQGFGSFLEVDPGSAPLIPNGLPLNHNVAFENRVSLVIVFDQQISPAPGQLDLLWFDYFHNGEWKALRCKRELVELCGRRGSTVKLTPLSTLPPRGPLRIRIEPGFADFAGDAHTTEYTELLPAMGSDVQDFGGARVDAIFESFTVGGDEDGSFEDTTSDLGAPRAEWGSGRVLAVEAPNGLSRARSKWIPIGLAGTLPETAPIGPTFTFHGVDGEGRVRRSGEAVLLDPPVIGPFVPAAVLPFEVDLPVALLNEPSGRYAALPAMLRGERLRLDDGAGATAQEQVFNTAILGPNVRATLGNGCYTPGGFLFDCAPWDLGARFVPAGGATFDVRPQSFELYRGGFMDVMSIDHGVRFSFDATFADANGNPDPLAAFSSTAGWTNQIALLSGTPWDFIRFEIEFDLDLSNDGYSAAEGRPVIDFVRIPVDFRQ